jgi:hypothetical protein
MKVVHAAFVLLWTATNALAQSYSADDLSRRTIERRAIEAVIWGMPAVNTDLMLQEFVKLKGSPNQIVYWSRLPTWKNQTLTPNPDAVYLMPFFNTRDVGPVVLEIPAATAENSFTANIDDFWQVALEDAGPAGADQGKGGKYLILPPGYSGKAPDGYIPLRSSTYGGYALLRSTPRSGSEEDVSKAVEYGKRVKLYPLSQTNDPPPTVFVDAEDREFNSTIPYDLRFFQSLDRVVQAEPWQQRDRAMIDELRSLGIEKGKPFNPDAETQKLLIDSAREAQQWLEWKYATTFPPYNEGHHWAVPALPEVIKGQAEGYPDLNSYPTDARGLTYSFGFIGIKRLGAGQFYLITSTDKDGKPLDGRNTYRLTVPPDAPVSQYWSATVYDRATHAFIREMPLFSMSSHAPDIEKNANGFTDVYFGPKAPAGKQSNWIPTSDRGEFEVLFRLYGPQKALFDKSWKLPDVQRIEAQ